MRINAYSPEKYARTTQTHKSKRVHWFPQVPTGFPRHTQAIVRITFELLRRVTLVVALSFVRHPFFDNLSSSAVSLSILTGVYENGLVVDLELLLEAILT